MELVALPAWFRLEQGWLSIFGLLLDAFGFGLIAFEWFRGYIEMRAKTRIDYWERERAQKRKLRQEHRDMLAMTGVPEIAPVLENQEYLDDAAESAREEARLVQFQRSRALPFVVGALMCFVGFLFQLLGQWPGGIPWLGIVERL
jgi:hypothetical protein